MQVVPGGPRFAAHEPQHGQRQMPPINFERSSTPLQAPIAVAADFAAVTNRNSVYRIDPARGPASGVISRTTVTLCGYGYDSTQPPLPPLNALLHSDCTGNTNPFDSIVLAAAP
jgi:hypothetical protein